MRELLKELGLLDSDIKTYLFLIDNGPNIAGRISKETGIHRRNTYDALERLSKKGFISYITENSVNQYQANNPEFILNKLKSRVNEFKESLPILKEKINSWETKKETLFFRGLEGLKIVFFDQIKIKDDVLVIATNKDVSLTLKYFFPKYQLLRKEKKIKTRMIFDSTIKENSNYNILKKIPLAKMKFINSINSTNVSTYIYGNNVATIKWTKEPVAILIRDKDIAQNKKEIFELLWSL